MDSDKRPGASYQRPNSRGANRRRNEGHGQDTGTAGGVNVARPLKEIDKKQFENLCGLQCTKEEICGWFDVTDKTLENWCKRTYKAGFSEVFRQKRGLGKISLRRHQWRLA